MLSDLIAVERGAVSVEGRIWGPDLDKAEPLEAALAILDRAAAEGLETYALFWFNRMEAAGAHASVMVDRDGSEHFMVGGLCDAQMERRRLREEAFTAHFRGIDGARAALIKHAYRLGIFADNQPYASAEEAVSAQIAAGARLLVDPAGELSEAPAFPRRAARGSNAWAQLQRASHRYHATLRCLAGAGEAIAAIVRERGTACDNGWFFLEQPAPAAEVAA